ncbi:DNA-3-methyladenine glycosylase family protein [Limimaricola hongkongensis]|uniref:DNA-3-methyladenine glycosylase II n=1 Tax=Limimaricola hongkongensis DSM 17492 TaxID=1122180 RepID=A0A017HC13_9RHOB|nr:DNA-3-methyladenine glycosylase [Limimaricola hongkongensis]EYD71678.1 DNA-3-methyladenine glycosylase II [Limimaricola hongkongensis DSM 17492]
MGDEFVSERIITHEDQVAEGAAWLAENTDHFARLLEITGPLPLRRTPDGFGQLCSAIVSQQVSTASARAIRGRLETAGLMRPDTIAQADDDSLRACGLSRQKMRYLRALAASGIDFEALRTAPTPDVVATLTAVTGIGVWTAEIYAMFALGRADVFAPGDLALQEGARHLLGLEDRPKERALREIALQWSPWRAVAARGLWEYYHHVKGREGIL